jgi:hypothetical protein
MIKKLLKFSIVASLMLHFSLFVATKYFESPSCLIGTEGCGEGGDGSEQGSGGEESLGINATIIPKVNIITVPQSVIDNMIALENERKTLHLDDDCESYYGGVGITITNVWKDGALVRVIVDVHEGYPGEAIGLLRGDIILDQDILVGEIGKEIVFSVNRNGTIIKFRTRRAKICTKPFN